mmetsp:Transcript_48412/g.90712  ORF Transcript_48412/g.90712 Transcript_48412/m.90712 type:complete len:219 (+) Transcript_48412:50-706(+)
MAAAAVSEELPLPAVALQEESLFDVTAETVDAVLLFLGLDNAGKTTLLQMLKNDRMVAQVPTLHPQCEELVIDKVRYQAFDLAGHEIARRLWKDYFRVASAIVFMVDSADRARFPEAAEELKNLLKEATLQVPIAVLAQKVDLPGSATKEEFSRALEIPAESDSDRKMKVFMCSVMERKGYAEVMQWIQEQILQTSCPVAQKSHEVAPQGAESEDCMV